MKSEKRFYVYFHYRADSDEIFYIGKGCDYRHKSIEGRNEYWHRIVRRHGWKSFVFWENLPNECSLTIEKIFIHLHRKNGASLANSTSGGAGPNGYKHSEESRKKMSAALKGKKRPLESVEATAKAHRGMKRSEETRRRIGAASRGRVHTEETKIKMSNSHKGRTKAPFSGRQKDKKIYKFKNDSELFFGTRHDFLKLVEGNTTSLWHLMNGSIPKYKGWEIIND